MMTVEGVTNVPRGRTVAPDTKKRALDEYLAGARAIDVAARHQIPVKLLCNWKSNHKLDVGGKKNESAKVRLLERVIRHKDAEIPVLRDLRKKHTKACQSMRIRSRALNSNAPSNKALVHLCRAQQVSLVPASKSSSQQPLPAP